MINKKGSVLVIGVLFTVALMGFAGFVVDASQLYVDRNKLQTISDQAALAGAAKLSEGVTVAQNKVLEITGANGIADGDVTITTPHTISSDTSDPRYEASDLTYSSSDLIKVEIQKTHNYTFGQLFGLSTRVMTAYSVGYAGAPGDPNSVTGVSPLGIADQTFVVGDTYEVKQGGGGGSSNRRAMRLSGSGASHWRDDMKYGYTGTVSVGDSIQTKPGQMSGPTSQAVSHLLAEDLTGTYASHSDTSARVMVVMLTDPDPTSQSGTHSVEIVGFALFWLEGEGASAAIEAKYVGSAAVGSSGQATITSDSSANARLIK